MKRLSPVFSAVYLIAMITVVVGIDIAFFQHHLEWRLIGNIAVVAVFLAGYLILAKAKK